MKKLLVVVLIITSLMVWALSQVISSQALVVKPDQGNIDAAQKVKNLLHKIQYKVRSPQQKFSLQMSADELDAIGSFANRAVPQLRIHTNLSALAAQISVSLELPAPFSGWFMNAQITLLPSTEGLHIERFLLGNLEVGSQRSFALLIKLLDSLSEGLFSDLLERITEVRVQPEQMTVSIEATEPLQQQLNRLAAFIGLEGNRQEKEAIRHYHQFLVQLSDKFPNRKNLSLLAYLNPLINEAAVRSQRKSSVAQDENRAALLALGLYAGHRHFARVIGSFTELESMVNNMPHRLLLAGRHDLQQHFLYSIVFKLLADQGVSFVLGELKEMMDSGRGGSGFSFADLAADMGGNQFAHYATDVENALLLQSRFAGKINERWIFPRIDDLEENLSKHDFQAKYGEVDSSEYAVLVKKIQDRIDELQLYQPVE